MRTGRVQAEVSRGWNTLEIASRLLSDNWLAYEGHLRDDPVLTKTAINGFIYLLADWLAQARRDLQDHLGGAMGSGRRDLGGGRMRGDLRASPCSLQLPRTALLSHADRIAREALPPLNPPKVLEGRKPLEFDLRRVLRNSAIGIFFGPLVCAYYEFSDKVRSLRKQSAPAICASNLRKHSAHAISVGPSLLRLSSRRLPRVSATVNTINRAYALPASKATAACERGA